MLSRSPPELSWPPGIDFPPSAQWGVRQCLASGSLMIRRSAGVPEVTPPLSKGAGLQALFSSMWAPSPFTLEWLLARVNPLHSHSPWLGSAGCAASKGPRTPSPCQRLRRGRGGPCCPGMLGQGPVPSNGPLPFSYPSAPQPHLLYQREGQSREPGPVQPAPAPLFHPAAAGDSP